MDGNEESGVGLILASGSPRRRELLEKTGLSFLVRISTAEEVHDGSLGMGELCELNARLKAEAVAVDFPGSVVIGADTLVFIDGEPLGKPKGMEEAREMLRRLSGRVHQVCTGLCLAGPQGRVSTFHEVTEVRFRVLDEAVIERYLMMTEPLDKAGAYGIQDCGEMIVEGIDGAFDNVMGLPTGALLNALDEIGLPFNRR